ncbi:hypothetical protein CEUSTIGMA_g6687.t1 [Chlamydomonas eustigma]|uniref:Protein kinase domain-containing protein n=1 Tax=Chlamydomonas eustigma TaxID=1157962 RepID=A0A250X858_9CHLO|nr:hypothetical protein CEUSTIGMA_g6687.t1 [Chlamydomonas eustigma]|eukprot:GAX79247.1 hypothetical protein CEUSTIGMA_g6687.t1 [Chlamydomonas eustigma]
MDATGQRRAGVDSPVLQQAWKAQNFTQLAERRSVNKLPSRLSCPSLAVSVMGSSCDISNDGVLNRIITTAPSSDFPSNQSSFSSKYAHANKSEQNHDYRDCHDPARKALLEKRLFTGSSIHQGLHNGEAQKVPSKQDCVAVHQLEHLRNSRTSGFGSLTLMCTHPLDFPTLQTPSSDSCSDISQQEAGHLFLQQQQQQQTAALTAVQADDELHPDGSSGPSASLTKQQCKRSLFKQLRGSTLNPQNVTTPSALVPRFEGAATAAAAEASSWIGEANPKGTLNPNIMALLAAPSISDTAAAAAQSLSSWASRQQEHEDPIQTSTTPYGHHLNCSTLNPTAPSSHQDRHMALSSMTHQPLLIREGRDQTAVDDDYPSLNDDYPSLNDDYPSLNDDYPSLNEAQGTESIKMKCRVLKEDIAPDTNKLFLPSQPPSYPSRCGMEGMNAKPCSASDACFQSALEASGLNIRGNSDSFCFVRPIFRSPPLQPNPTPKAMSKDGQKPVAVMKEYKAAPCSETKNQEWLARPRMSESTPRVLKAQSAARGLDATQMTAKVPKMTMDTSKELIPGRLTDVEVHEVHVNSSLGFMTLSGHVSAPCTMLMGQCNYSKQQATSDPDSTSSSWSPFMSIPTFLCEATQLKLQQPGSKNNSSAHEVGRFVMQQQQQQCLSSTCSSVNAYPSADEDSESFNVESAMTNSSSKPAQAHQLYSVAALLSDELTVGRYASSRALKALSATVRNLVQKSSNGSNSSQRGGSRRSGSSLSADNRERQQSPPGRVKRYMATTRLQEPSPGCNNLESRGTTTPQYIHPPTCIVFPAASLSKKLAAISEQQELTYALPPWPDADPNKPKSVTCSPPPFSRVMRTPTRYPSTIISSRASGNERPQAGATVKKLTEGPKKPAVILASALDEKAVYNEVVLGTVRDPMTKQHEVVLGTARDPMTKQHEVVLGTARDPMTKQHEVVLETARDPMTKQHEVVLTMTPSNQLTAHSKGTRSLPMPLGEVEAVQMFNSLPAHLGGGCLVDGAVECAVQTVSTTSSKALLLASAAALQGMTPAACPDTATTPSVISICLQHRSHLHDCVAAVVSTQQHHTNEKATPPLSSRSVDASPRTSWCSSSLSSLAEGDLLRSSGRSSSSSSINERMSGAMSFQKLPTPPPLMMCKKGASCLSSLAVQDDTLPTAVQDDTLPTAVQDDTLPTREVHKVMITTNTMHGLDQGSLHAAHRSASQNSIPADALKSRVLGAVTVDGKQVAGACSWKQLELAAVGHCRVVSPSPKITASSTIPQTLAPPPSTFLSPPSLPCSPVFITHRSLQLPNPTPHLLSPSHHKLPVSTSLCVAKALNSSNPLSTLSTSSSCNKDGRGPPHPQGSSSSSSSSVFLGLSPRRVTPSVLTPPWEILSSAEVQDGGPSHHSTTPMTTSPQYGPRLDLLEHIGSGAHGEVYKGVWNGAFVAVKVTKVPLAMPLSGRNCRRGVYGLQYEGWLTSCLRHPNIVQLYSAYCLESTLHLPKADVRSTVSPRPAIALQSPRSSAGCLTASTARLPLGSPLVSSYLIMEYCSLGNLEEALTASSGRKSCVPHVSQPKIMDDERTERSTISPQGARASSVAARIPTPIFPPPTTPEGWFCLLMTAKEICVAVSHLHSLRVVHGDLKARSVLLTAAPPCCQLGPDARGFTVKISDFGSSAVLWPASASASTSGSPPVRTHDDDLHTSTELMDGRTSAPQLGALGARILSPITTQPQHHFKSPDLKLDLSTLLTRCQQEEKNMQAVAINSLPRHPASSLNQPLPSLHSDIFNLGVLLRDMLVLQNNLHEVTNCPEGCIFNASEQVMHLEATGMITKQQGYHATMQQGYHATMQQGYHATMQQEVEMMTTNGYSNLSDYLALCMACCHEAPERRPSAAQVVANMKELAGKHLDAESAAYMFPEALFSLVELPRMQQLNGMTPDSAADSAAEQGVTESEGMQERENLTAQRLTAESGSSPVLLAQRLTAESGSSPVLLAQRPRNGSGVNHMVHVTPPLGGCCPLVTPQHVTPPLRGCYPLVTPQPTASLDLISQAYSSNPSTDGHGKKSFLGLEDRGVRIKGEGVIATLVSQEHEDTGVRIRGEGVIATLVSQEHEDTGVRIRGEGVIATLVSQELEHEKRLLRQQEWELLDCDERHDELTDEKRTSRRLTRHGDDDGAVDDAHGGMYTTTYDGRSMDAVQRILPVDTLLQTEQRKSGRVRSRSLNDCLAAKYVEEILEVQFVSCHKEILRHDQEMKRGLKEVSLVVQKPKRRNLEAWDKLNPHSTWYMPCTPPAGLAGACRRLLDSISGRQSFGWSRFFSCFKP